MAVEGEAMLWKPSASNSLWDARRLPNLPDLAPAINRSSSFEHESSAIDRARGPAAGKDDGAKAKPSEAPKQALSSEPVSQGIF